MEINNTVASVVAGLVVAVGSNGAHWKLNADDNKVQMTEATEARSVATDALSTYFMDKLDEAIKRLDKVREDLDEAEDELLECRLGGS